MSKSTSYNSANSDNKNIISESFEHIPCVQYGFPIGKGPARTPELRTIFDRIPKDATTVSPIYALTRDQYDEHQSWDNPYQVSGYNSIATMFQDECEADDHVLYPVHIESDTYHEKGPETLIKWFQEFVEDYLDVPFDTSRLYFSGNRSIHVHVPRFVSGECAREQLKELAETFCEETGAELDCGLYYAKRLFRLPGVEHTKTDLKKVEIEPEWEHARIVREAATSTSGVPDSYESVLRHVYTTQPSLTVDTPHKTLDPPYDFFQVLDSERAKLKFKMNERDIEIPLIEQEQCPNDVEKIPVWTQYNAKEFSPYALASGGSRSVAVIQVKGSPFARKNRTGGSYGYPVHALIPAFFYGARGCAGDEFIKNHEHAPLQLSKLDYEKWNYEAGDNVVIIGGKSNQSVIFRLDSWQATVAGHALTGREGGRQVALDYLEIEGYDTGKAGKTSHRPKMLKKTKKTDGRINTMKTEAAKLQRRAERENIESLNHMERWRVACRLLLQGWEPAWQWFKTQFGPSFDPNITRDQFLSVINSFPDDYSHVEVPME